MSVARMGASRSAFFVGGWNIISQRKGPKPSDDERQKT